MQVHHATVPGRQCSCLLHPHQPQVNTAPQASGREPALGLRLITGHGRAPWTCSLEGAPTVCQHWQELTARTFPECAGGTRQPRASKRAGHSHTGQGMCETRQETWEPPTAGQQPVQVKAATRPYLGPRLLFVKHEHNFGGKKTVEVVCALVKHLGSFPTTPQFRNVKSLKVTVSTGSKNPTQPQT